MDALVSFVPVSLPVPTKQTVLALRILRSRYLCRGVDGRFTAKEIAAFAPGSFRIKKLIMALDRLVREGKATSVADQERGTTTYSLTPKGFRVATAYELLVKEAVPGRLKKRF